MRVSTRCAMLAFAVILTPATGSRAETNSLFVAINPCRIVDTRSADPVGPISGGSTRTFDVVGVTNYSAQGGSATGCGIPGFTSGGKPRVLAIAVNVVAVQPTAQGNLLVFPTDITPGTASTLNFAPPSVPLNIANGVIVPVRQDAQGADITVRPNKTTQVLMDVTGYFVPVPVRGEVTGGSPNLIGGHPENQVVPGFTGVTIGGGGINAPLNNEATADFVVIAGGVANKAGGVANSYAVVGGGNGNNASGNSATIAGGASNLASATSASVGGGIGNQATGPMATVSGGHANKATADQATVGGGDTNLAIGLDSTVSGGSFNQATDFVATVSGGTGNSAVKNAATISGGAGNVASAPASTIAGGSNNVITPTGTNASVSGGDSNLAGGVDAIVAGGVSNKANGAASFAAGTHASALHDGSFVWADSLNEEFASTAIDQFSARARGGFKLVTKPAGGGIPEKNCSIDAIGNLLCTGTVVGGSDRAIKTGFSRADTDEILREVEKLPIERWSYQDDPSGVVHVGPMAQDFRQAFRVGQDRSIAMVDADGVALAAIQALARRVEQDRLRIETAERALRAEIARRDRASAAAVRAKDQEIATLRARLAAAERGPTEPSRIADSK